MKECIITYENYELDKIKTSLLCDKTPRFSLTFQNYISYYKIQCYELPTFIYNKINKYFDNFEASKMQFYAEKVQDKNAVKLIFQNNFGGEICMFKYKTGNTKEELDDCTYISKCGNTEGCCYSPCNNIELEFDNEVSKFIKVVIQTRKTFYNNINCNDCSQDDENGIVKIDYSKNNF